MSKPTLALFICSLLITTVGCSQSSTTLSSQPHTTSTADEPAPVLYNLGGVDLNSDIEFNQYQLDPANGQVASVYIFGQPLPAHPGEPVRINPNLEFGGLAEPIEIVAAIDGVVAFVRSQPDSTDYEVFLQTSDNSEWVIGYDHLTDLQVEQGDQVAVGDVLGKAAITGQGTYRYELQINHEAGDSTTMYCPTDLLDSSVQADWQVALDTFVANWDNDYQRIYSENAYPTQTGGCVKPTVTVEESEGR